MMLSEYVFHYSKESSKSQPDLSSLVIKSSMALQISGALFKAIIWSDFGKIMSSEFFILFFIIKEFSMGKMVSFLPWIKSTGVFIFCKIDSPSNE